MEVSNEFASPKYRFQSVQDADNAVQHGKHDKALNIYEEVTSNKNLEWWSLERFTYEQDASYRWMPGYTPVPEPSEDPTEYSRLAAYAYYRIMLLHLAQGQEAEAASTYQTLLSTFGNDPYAAPYVEMASAFWEAYQPTKKCTTAVQRRSNMRWNILRF